MFGSLIALGWVCVFYLFILEEFLYFFFFLFSLYSIRPYLLCFVVCLWRVTYPYHFFDLCCNKIVVSDQER